MSDLLTTNGHSNTKPFRLSERFIDKYKDVKPPFGFNGLGELVYMRTYSRIKEDGTNEKWWETVRRVVEGTYTIQRRWIEMHELGWNAHQAQRSGQEMYDRIFNMKFLPPGRGLWAMGTDIVNERGLYAALNNCAFTSTENIKEDPAESFVFLMDMSMLGVGVGFDAKGAGKIDIKEPTKGTSYTYKIPDTREGWVESVRLLLNSYFYGTAPVEFDYSEVRPKGSVIKTFGGISAGPEPLAELHVSLKILLSGVAGEPISSTTIVDIMNMIGKAVVAGNVRRTAEICFGEPSDEEYLRLKDYKWDKEQEKYVGPSAHRAEIGWTSNNSIFCDLGFDYSKVSERISLNGEPGIAWLENMRAYSRMKDSPTWIDKRVRGANPCVEQSLEDGELCNLVETFPSRHESKEDFLRTIKFAYLYAKTVTLGKTHWAKTNRVMLRNRRIGASMSGVVQFLETHGIEELRQWSEEGYKEICKWDDMYSEWFAVPKSIKKTSIKPSGTVSLLVGVPPGIHWPEYRYYIRRVNIAKNSPMVKILKNAGYRIEDSVSDASSIVVEVPIETPPSVRTTDQVSLWEKMSLAAFMQKYWADNQVSVTVSFNPDTEGNMIANALNYFQYQLKAVSFLPIKEYSYAQMPYERISEDKYKKMTNKIKQIDFSNISNNIAITDRFCDSDVCEVDLKG